MDSVGYQNRRRPDRRVWREGQAADATVEAVSGRAPEPVAEVRIVHDASGERLGELAILQRITDLGGPHTDRSGIITELLELVAEVVDGERPMLFLYNGDSDEFEAHSLVGSPKQMPLPEPSIVRRVLVSNEPEMVNDASAQADIKHVVAAPLSLGTGRTGVLAVLNSRRGAFVERELRMLTMVAAGAAVLVQNAGLQEAVERQSQELAALHRLAQVLATAETLDRAVGESERIVSDILDCARTLVLLYDEESNCLVVHPSSIEADDGACPQISLSTPSLAGTVFRTQTPLLSNDAADDAWVGEALREVVGIDTCLVVPITSGSRSIGVLVATNATKGAFDAGDLRFTTLLGVRIGNVIEASRVRERERALLQELRELDRNRSEFVSMLAHELKSPMTTIKGFADILQNHATDLDERRRDEYFGIISVEIDRLCDLVNDLLDAARMDMGTLRTEPQRVRLTDVIENLVNVHPSLTASHRINLMFDNGLPDVLCDEDRIRQVVLNLLQNATRYSPENSAITIESDTIAEGDREFVRICVSDEGIGIAPEDLERVFSKFVMLPKPDWATQGTGLGLFIANGIVKAHGGRIWAESDVGSGSRFFFTLPVAG